MWTASASRRWTVSNRIISLGSLIWTHIFCNSSGGSVVSRSSCDSSSNIFAFFLRYRFSSVDMGFLLFLVILDILTPVHDCINVLVHEYCTLVHYSYTSSASMHYSYTSSASMYSYTSSASDFMSSSHSYHYVDLWVGRFYFLIREFVTLYTVFFFFFLAGSVKDPNNGTSQRIQCCRLSGYCILCHLFFYEIYSIKRMIIIHLSLFRLLYSRWYTWYWFFVVAASVL